jgi:hypothetical protein
MTDILSWNNSIDKEVKTIDDKMVGKIRLVDKQYYFVPSIKSRGTRGKVFG